MAGTGEMGQENEQYPGSLREEAESPLRP